MRIQISCINKSDRQSAYERIIYCGGVLPDGQRWKKTQEAVIRDIESNLNQYFVKVGLFAEADVIVAESAWGNKYIKTTNDGEMPNNLLSLPECP